MPRLTFCCDTESKVNLGYLAAMQRRRVDERDTEWRRHEHVNSVSLGHLTPGHFRQELHSYVSARHDCHARKRCIRESRVGG